MDEVWEKLHSQRAWGKYPSIDLVKTVMRQFKDVPTSSLKVLEVGCGAGANLSFLIREGFQVYGMDGSESAIENAHTHLKPLLDGSLVRGKSSKDKPHCELSVGNFEVLNYSDNYFDIVIDNLAIYANTCSAIDNAYKEAFRVLKPGGFMYSRVWGDKCTGSRSGQMIEQGTSNSPTSGPCRDMGVSHFFKKEELKDFFSSYARTNIRRLCEEDEEQDFFTEEWVVWAQK